MAVLTLLRPWPTRLRVLEAGVVDSLQGVDMLALELCLHHLVVIPTILLRDIHQQALRHHLDGQTAAVAMTLTEVLRHHPVAHSTTTA